MHVQLGEEQIEVSGRLTATVWSKQRKGPHRQGLLLDAPWLQAVLQACLGVTDVQHNLRPSKRWTMHPPQHRREHEATAA